MARTLPALLTAAVLASTLAACASGGSPAAAPTPTVTVTVTGVRTVEAQPVVAKPKATPVAPAVFTVRGALILTVDDPDNDLLAAGSFCMGSGGYDDISDTANVVVTDAGGKTVAVSQLESGVKKSSTVCSFHFSVPDVPMGSKFYGVQVSHRGSLMESEADLRAAPLVLTLGKD